MSLTRIEPRLPHLTKAATGIAGLDEILLGGLPASRPTRICGGAGCGKPPFGMTFQANGPTKFGENDVFVRREETGGILQSLG